MMEILPYMWFFVIVCEVALYVVLDGADLGVGILSLFSRDERHRSLWMRPLGPIWSANETWLVIVGATLFGAFPTAFGVVLGALYIPAMILVFGFVLRAAAFEFHEFSADKRFWGVLFGVGSLCAAIGQGFVAGGLFQGVSVSGAHFSGGVFDWVSWWAFGAAVLVVCAYVFLGVLSSFTDARGRYWYHVFVGGIVVVLGALVLHVFPYVVPNVLTITEAAASPNTLRFMLYGIAPLLPVIVLYHRYLYTLFRKRNVRGY